MLVGLVVNDPDGYDSDKFEDDNDAKYSMPDDSDNDNDGQQD